MTLILNKGMSMKNLKMKMEFFNRISIVLEKHWKKYLQDLFKLRIDYAVILWNKELNIWRRKELHYSKKRRILNFKPMRWTCLSLKHVIDFKIVSNKTILSSNLLIESILILNVWLKHTIQISKKLMLIWEEVVRPKGKMNKNMRSSTKRKKKLMNSLNNLKKRRLIMRKTSRKIKRL